MIAGARLLLVTTNTHGVAVPLLCYQGKSKISLKGSSLSPADERGGINKGSASKGNVYFLWN